MTYYSRGGPVGQLIAEARREGTKRRFGVVGLGTASLAAYAASGQTWTFFEINPAVERLARDPEYFTFLKDCAPDAKVVTGDARLMLAAARRGVRRARPRRLQFGRHPGSPDHARGTGALSEQLAPGGVMAVHISNRYLDLGPVVGATARDAGLTTLVQTHVPSPEQQRISAEISPSRWVLLARSVHDFGELARNGRWSTLDDVDGPVWTDDYSNVLGVLRH